MSDFIFSTFALGSYILGGSFIILLFLSLYFIKPYRPLFALMLAIPLTATLAYIFMANKIGIYMQGDNPISITRYIDWTITTPLLLYILSNVMIIKGTTRTRTVIKLVVLDIVMLAAGLISEFSHGVIMYMWFMVSGGCYLVMLYIIIDKLLFTEQTSSHPTHRLIVMHMAWIVIILWSFYPMVWILGIHGINLISYTHENIGYLILDFLTKIGFASLLLRYLYIASKLNILPTYENTIS